MDVGIADLLKDVDMPLLEMVRLVYPEWRMKETSYGDKREGMQPAMKKTSGE